MSAIKDIFNVLGSFKAEGVIDPQRLSKFLDDKNVPKYVRDAVEEMQDQVFDSEIHFIEELGHIIESVEKAEKFKNKALKILKFTSDATTLIIDDDHIIPRIMSRFFGKHLEISINVFRPKRTSAQNRYLHGVVVPMVMSWLLESQGEHVTKDEAKEFIYQHALRERVTLKQIGGYETYVGEAKHFSQMNTVEFNEAVEMLQVWFAERGCHIPNPTHNSFIADYVKNKKGRKRN